MKLRASVRVVMVTCVRMRIFVVVLLVVLVVVVREVPMSVRVATRCSMGVSPVHGPLRTAEQAACLRRLQPIHNLGAGNELKGNIFKMMGVHDRIHDQSIHGHGHIQKTALRDGGPVLVAQRVTKLHAALNHLIGGQFSQTAQINNHHLTEVDSADHGPSGGLIPEEHIAIVQKGAPFKRHRNGLPTAGLFAKPSFLGVPLTQFKNINFGSGQPRLPRRFLVVPKHAFHELHSEFPFFPCSVISPLKNEGEHFFRTPPSFFQLKKYSCPKATA